MRPSDTIQDSIVEAELDEVLSDEVLSEAELAELDEILGPNESTVCPGPSLTESLPSESFYRDSDGAYRKGQTLVGLARLSSLTIKLDQLMQTDRVKGSAVLSTALRNMKRDILVSLAQIMNRGQK